MTPEQAIKALATLRLAVGAAAWLTPNVAGKGFGLDPKANPQAPYLARLFGIRDVALALGTQQAAGAPQKQWLQMGALCDAADFLAAVAGGRKGYLSKTSATLVAVPALAALGMGVVALKNEE